MTLLVLQNFLRDFIDMLQQLEMIFIGLLHPMCCEGETLMCLLM
jgi:hypothetical protein